MEQRLCIHLMVLVIVLKAPRFFKVYIKYKNSVLI